MLPAYDAAMDLLRQATTVAKNRFGCKRQAAPKLPHARPLPREDVGATFTAMANLLPLEYHLTAVPVECLRNDLSLLVCSTPVHSWSTPWWPPIALMLRS